MATAESQLAWGELARDWYEQVPSAAAEAKQAVTHKVDAGGHASIDFAFASSRALQRRWTNSLARKREGAASEAVFWKEEIREDGKKGPWADLHEVACRSPLLPIGFARLWSALDEWLLARCLGEGAEARCVRSRTQQPGEGSALARGWVAAIQPRLLSSSLDKVKMSAIKAWAIQEQQQQQQSAVPGGPLADEMQVESLRPPTGLDSLGEKEAAMTFREWAALPGLAPGAIREARRLVLRREWLAKVLDKPAGGQSTDDCPDLTTPAGRQDLRALSLNLRQTAFEVSSSLGLTPLAAAYAPSPLALPGTLQEALMACLEVSWRTRYGALAEHDDAWMTAHGEWVEHVVLVLLPQWVQSRRDDGVARVRAVDRGGTEAQVRERVHQALLAADRVAACEWIASVLHDLHARVLGPTTEQARKLEVQWGKDLISSTSGIGRWLQWCHDAESPSSDGAALAREVHAWWDDLTSTRHVSKGLLPTSSSYSAMARLLLRVVCPLAQSQGGLLRMEVGVRLINVLSKRKEDDPLLLTTSLLLEASRTLEPLKLKARALPSENESSKTIRALCLLLRNYFLETLDPARRARLIDGVDALWRERLSHDYARQSLRHQASADRREWAKGLTAEEIAQRPERSFYTEPAPGAEDPHDPALQPGQAAPQQPSLDLDAFRAAREQAYREAEEELPRAWEAARRRLREDPSVSSEDLAAQASAALRLPDLPPPPPQGAAVVDATPPPPPGPHQPMEVEEEEM